MRKQPWIYGAGGALLATAATITAFALVSGDGAVRDPDRGIATSPSPDPVETVLVPVYYQGEVSYLFGEQGERQVGLRLFREWLAADSAGTPGEVAADALEQMFQAPTDEDYSTPWHADVDVLGVTHEGGVVTVDLTGPVQDADVGAESAELAVQQLVYTVQGALSVMKDDAATYPVRVLVDGEPAGDLWGHVDASEPFARAPRNQTQAPVWIIEPEDGTTVEQPVTVEGVASTFEGNLNWRLLHDGTEVDSGFATASEGAPGLGEYTFELGRLEPGDYVVEVFEPSPLDGSPTYVDDKTFTIE